MAQFNSDQFANAIAVPPTFTKPTEVSGRKRTLYASYTTVGTEVAGDALVIGKLPKGARVTSAEVIVPASFVTSSSKIGYGTLSGSTYTATDDDRWGSGVDLSSAARKQYLTVAADIDYLTTAEVAIALTFTTGNPGSSKQIAVLIEYVVD
jgi:hypothetical protein